MLYNWQPIPQEVLDTLPAQKPMEVIISGKKLCLLRRGEELFAFAATCPHSGVPLCDGWLDARGHIVCPLHKYRFNPANGYNSSGEGYKLRTFPVEVRDEGYFVGLL